MRCGRWLLRDGREEVILRRRTGFGGEELILITDEAEGIE